MNSLANEKPDNEIAREWDQIARKRADHILSDRDLSFSYVLVPSVLELLEDCDVTKIIDIGCGVGVLSAILASNAVYVVGLDSSPESIRIARELHGDVPNLCFEEAPVDTYAAESRRSGFSLAVANMFLVNVRDVAAALTSIRQLLVPQGRLILTITHPCFWPDYWNYAEETWFDYWKEIPIESSFRITLESYGNLKTTHFHRPLEFYFDEFRKAGFEVERFTEPRPPNAIAPRYPIPWRYPRFLAMRCRLG